jgi:hypothetical protein
MKLTCLIYFIIWFIFLFYFKNFTDIEVISTMQFISGQCHTLLPVITTQEAGVLAGYSIALQHSNTITDHRPWNIYVHQSTDVFTGIYNILFKYYIIFSSMILSLKEREKKIEFLHPRDKNTIIFIKLKTCSTWLNLYLESSGIFLIAWNKC